jgi:hypothetical protein
VKRASSRSRGGKGEGSWLFNSTSWIEWEIDEAVARVTGNAPTARQSRELYWAARAKREQLEVKKLEGQLVDVAEVETIWARLTANFRTRLLALPTKLAGRLVGIGAANVIRSKLEDEVHSALSELSAEANAIADGEAAPSDGKDSQHGIA